MENKVITSPKYSLAWRDTAKSLIVAVLSGVLASVYEAIQKDGDLSKLNWKTIGLTALFTALAYLFKNGVLEPAKTIVISPTNTEAKEITSDIKSIVK